MSKSTKTWMIVATSLVLIGGIIFGGAMSMMSWNFGKLSTARYETNRYEITEAYKNILLTTNTADIIFEVSEKTTVVCHERSSLKHEVFVKDGVLAGEKL